MTDAAVEVPPIEPARWRARAAAIALDLVPGLAVMVTMGMAALSFPAGGPWWWVATVLAASAFLATAVNRILLPVITGWSLGRAVTGLEVVRGGDAAESGVGSIRLLLRDAAHLLDTLPLLLGWIWPLRDKRRRTFADMVVRTEVRPTTRQRPVNLRVLTMAVCVGASALCLAGAASAYAVVYQREHRSDLARTQILRQGPKIVADMLSYDPETLQEDFERAQNLATAKYREQLVPQQEAIRDAKPVPNFYRVTDAAVLDAAPHRATVLLFLQGQRGTPGKERLISATVRVVFVESADTWQVDDLSVVSKPEPAEGDK
ncbi:RDD family protein [Mycolicibacter minnesotensis]